MDTLTRGFGGLTVVKDNLQRQQDRQAALKVLCPPHKDSPGTFVLRVGIDKRGHYSFFMASKGRENNPREWRPGGVEDELSNAQYEAFHDLLKSGQLRPENGPHGCHLFYHIDEGVELFP